MQVLRTIQSMRDWRRPQQQPLALVPTMGYLHEGHLSLVRCAQEKAPVVVVSIFVNPLQFGPNEDFDRYPRAFETDRQKLEELGVDAIFAPSAEQMYPDGPCLTRVSVESMSSVLCGKTRPIHFAGVATVVSKLFHIVGPDFAVFGQKDWQQLAVIRRMVKDLNFPVDVIGVPTYRSQSGLALSSRNEYLSKDEKEQASYIYRSLQEAQQRYEEGERQRQVLARTVSEGLKSHGLEAEYVEIVDPDSLLPSPELLAGPALIAVACQVGRARLIDNILLGRNRAS